MSINDISDRALAQAVREIGERARAVLREVDQLAAEIDAAEPQAPDAKLIDVAAKVSVLPEFARIESPLILDIVTTAFRIAAPAAAVPDGCVLVPREPTHAMLAAVNDWRMDVLVAEDDTAEFPVSQDECERIYSAMIAAAPKPQEQQ